MELIVYNRDLITQGVIDKIISLVWVRRFYSPGEFKLLVPFTEKHKELLKMYGIITKRGDTEAAEIKSVHIRKNTQGMEEIEVHGKFLSNWIGKRLVLNLIRETAAPQHLISRIVAENVTNPANPLRRLNNILQSSIAHIVRGHVEYISEPFINALIATQNLAKISALGFNILVNARTRIYYFNIVEGRNLTSGQTVNHVAVFSVDFDNILEQSYEHSTEQKRTMAYVGGEENALTPQRVVEVERNLSGFTRDEVFINASDINQTWRDNIGIEHTMTNAQYDALLHQRGIQELTYFSVVEAFSSKINTYANLKYKVDYDLGDIVTCIDRRWGIVTNVPITEITEVYQNHPHPEIEIVFGESLPTLAEQIRKINIQ